MSTVTEKCPAYSAFFGSMGATAAVVFSGKFINEKTFLILVYYVFSFVQHWVPLMVQLNQVVVYQLWLL